MLLAQIIGRTYGTNVYGAERAGWPEDDAACKAMVSAVAEAEGKKGTRGEPKGDGVGRNKGKNKVSNAI
jgi:hypothetical protein